MRSIERLWIAVSLCGTATSAWAVPLPAAVAAMIDDAAANDVVFDAVVNTARRTNPSSADEISAQVSAIRQRKADARTAELESRSPFEGWNGSTEVGVTSETGNTDSVALVVALKLTRESLRWRHDFSFDAHVKAEDKVLTKKRYLIGYDGQYSLSPRFYVVLVGSWTQDVFAGFNSRFLESAGLGTRVFTGDRLKLNLEAGPALRQTDYSKGGHASGAAMRFAGDLKWKLTSWLTFSEVAAYVAQSSGSTLSSLTSLNTRLSESFSTRLSFDVQNDDNPPQGREAADTTTRLTILYEF